MSEITSTDQISAITSTELVRNEVDDRATMIQKSSRPHVTQFVSGAPPSDKELTLDGYIRQVESGGSPYVAINAGFKMGF